MNPDDKSWMRLYSGVRACNIGYVFTEIDQFKEHHIHTLENCIRSNLSYYIGPSPTSYVYIDSTATVKHILSLTEARRLLKLKEL